MESQCKSYSGTCERSSTLEMPIGDVVHISLVRKSSQPISGELTVVTLGQTQRFFLDSAHVGLLFDQMCDLYDVPDCR